LLNPDAGFVNPSIMQDLQNTIALLARTPAALDALLRGLPEMWTHRNEGDKTMTVFDVIGHLIHAEKTNWMPRLKTILQSGKTQPMPSFDRWGHVQECRGKSLEHLLDELAHRRAENLQQLQSLHLRDKELALLGKHPAIGFVTVSELIAAWAVHDLTHLHQISRIMAHQYWDDVGPFSKLLGVLQCTGHSTSA
jgi:hypothetical protein